MRTDPDLWDYHMTCQVPRQARYYKVALEGGIVPEQKAPITVNTLLLATKDVTGLWDGNSVMAYTHPGLAICLQPIIEGFPTVEVWECEADPKMATIEGVVACQNARLIKQSHFSLGILNLIRFACGCVSHVQSDKGFTEWLLDWWNGQEGYYSTDEMARISWRVAERERRHAKEGNGHKIYCPKAFVYYAAHYLCAACLHYRKPTYKAEDLARRLAQSVMYSIYAAEQMNHPLPAVTILERSFVAKLQ